MIEVGQLRVWKKQPHGGQFYNIPDGTLLLVTACEDNYVGNGNPAAVRKYTVLQDSETPWFVEFELEEHTVLVE